MNEKLKELYSYLKRQNATDLTIEQFFAAYGNDRNKAKDVYDFVKSQQMTDLKESDFFNAYFGNAETPQPEVKKKDEGMGLPSEDGSSVSSETEVVEGAVLSDNTLDKKVDWNAMAERESAIINEEQKKESTSGFVSEQAIFGEGGSKANTEVVDPFEQTSQITEKDFFTGTFGNILRAIDRVSPIGIGDFIDDQARAIAGGAYQGILAENASDLLLAGSKASDEDIESYLEALRDSQKYGSSDEFMEYQKIYQEHGEGILGVVLGLAHTGVTVVPEILLNSYTAMIANKDARYALEATVLGGAGIGATTGTAVGPAGTAAGAAGGAVAALPFAFAAAGSAMEFGSTFSELLLEEAGNRKLTKELIADILNDEEAYKRIRNKAITRGLTIGVIDALTGKMGGKLTTGILTKGGTQAAKQATKKEVLKAVVGSSLVEGAGGSAGEAAARALIGQDMDVSEIALEGIAEMPGSVKSFAQTALSTPTYKVNGSSVSIEVIDDLINTMTLDEIVQGNIEISNDYNGMEFKLQERIKKLKAEADIILANPNINKPTLDKISELQLELDKLKVNDTEVSKQRSASIRAEIKNLQENQLEGTVEETTKTSYNSLSPEDKMELRTKALDELEKEGVESPTNKDIDIKAVSILDKELQLLEGKPKKKKKSFVEGLGKTKDIGDVMEGGIEVDMDGTKVIITEDEKGVTLESIETEDGKKGQGNAEAAIKQITEKADRDGVDVTLKVVPKDKTVDAKRLQSLYERNGFKMQEDGVTMVRSVNTFDNVSDNLFINRKDSSPLLGLIPQKTKSFAMTAAKLASKAIRLIAPEVKIVLHESEGEYLNYTSPLDSGELASSGEYNPETNTIHINLSNVKKSTVAHEVFHAVLLNKLKNNDALAKKISDDMVRVVQRRLPKNHKLRIAVEAHAAKYQGVDAQFQTEEQIAELIGLLSSKEDGYTQLDNDMKSVIKRFLINLAKKLNIPLPKNWGSDQEVVDLINTLSRKTRTGEAITESDVKLLDVKEDTEGGEQQGSEGEVGKIKISRQQKDVIDAPSVNNDPRPWVRKVTNTIDVFTLNGKNFITNMYDYTNAGLTELGNGYSIELLGGRNYVPIIMNKTGKKLGDVSNLAAFNTKSQAEGFVRQSIEGDANYFAPHSGTLDGSWQFQQHIFEQLVDLVLDKNILTNEELIEIFDVNLRNESAKKLYAERIKSIKEKGYYTKKVDNKEVKVTKKPNKPSNFLSAFKKFRKASGLEINNLNSFKSDPKELVRFLNIENNFSPDLRKNFNQKIAANKKFQKAIGVNNLEEFHQRIIDPLNKGVVGGEIMTFIKFDPSTFEIVKTDPTSVEHHPSFGWVVKAKIEEISQPEKFHKSYDITEEYIKYNSNETVVSRKADVTEDEFKKSNVSSSAGSIPKVAKVATRQQRIDKASEKLIELFDRDNIPLTIAEAKAMVEEVYDWTTWYDGISSYVNDLFGEYGEDILSILPLSSMAANSAATVGMTINNVERIYKGEKPNGVAEYYGYVTDFLEGKGIRSDKMYNFLKALLGDKNAVAVDMHVYSIIMGKDPNKKQVNPSNKKEFERAKEFVNTLAKEMDLAPREVQAALWALNILRTNGKPDSYEQYFEKQVKERKLKERIEGWRSEGYKPFSEIRKTKEQKITPATRQQKGIEQAMENGEVIQTDSELIFFKGMQPKMKNGKPFSVHKIKKGSFAALDKNIALDYKGDKPLKQFTIPKGTTVEVVNLPSDAISLYRINEEKAINASEAQVVKLVTTDLRGKSQQYVIKDAAILKTSKDVKESSVTSNNKKTFTARQQKGLINFSEKDAIKFSKIGVDDARTIQAMNSIGLSGVKFTDEGVNKKIKESLDELYGNYKSYLLSIDGSEITRLMQFEIDAAIEDALPDNVINQLKEQINNDKARKDFISNLRKTQDDTADQWVSYLKQSEYSDAFKYLMLDAVLTNNYDLKSLNYNKRTKATTRNISPFDAGTLAMLYASDSKALLKSYVEMQKENLDNIINASQVKSTEGGKWLKFDGGPNAANKEETANSLSQLVQDTYWCTKTNALGQLRGGDFYVYVTGETPRIAIRMEGDRVGEVRGNASSKQDLEPDMLPVADEFLKDNIPNDSGKKWLDSIAFNKKAKEFLGNIYANNIGEKEIKEYVNIVSEGEKNNTDYGENGFVTKIKNAFQNKNNIKPEIREFVAFNFSEFDANKTKYFIGNADFKGSKITDLGSLEIISGNADFKGSKITDLGSLKSIGGSAFFTDSNVESLGSLESIGRNAYFTDSNVESLGSLKSVGGDAYFSRSKLESLGSLESVGGNADFEGSNVESLGSLKSIGGSAFFEGSKITDLGSLKSIGSNAYFRDSNVESLGSLESIGGNADFRDSNVESLGSLKSIGGSAFFEGSKITDLGSLKSIGSNAYFRDSNVESLGSLESIGGYADFEGSKLENEWNSIKNKPASRQSKSDVESFIKNARAQGISEAAIKIILANKGIDEKTIANALSKTKGGASGTVKVDESFVEGYDTTMKVIDGIIKKTKAKFAKEDTSPQTLLDSTLPYLQGSKVYENATDVQREKMVRNLRKKVGLKEKSSPSISKILGKVKDVKNILVSEKELLIKRIKDVREGATTTIKAIKLAQKEIINGVKDLKKKGKINTTQLTNIISKLNRIDMLSESDVNEFFDYMAKVFNDAEYVEKLRNANNKRNNALENIPKKIGIADSIAQSLVKIFSINASLIPDAVFDKYLKLVDQFGEGASVLTLSSVKVVEKTASEILNQIDIETSKIPQLQEYLESFEKKVIDSETGKLNYAETIRQMLADEVINESDYEVMKKYKSGILAKEEKASKTDAEILQEKKEIIKRLKRRAELNVENLPSRFEVERARRFKELIKDSEILMRLSVNQLKQIEKLVGNIRNGYFPSLANEMIVKLEGELNGNKLSKGIKEGKLLPKARLKSNLRKLFGAGNSILKEIKSTPLFFIDQVFGNFKESLIRNSLFDGLAKQIQQFESSYKKISGRIEKAQLAVFKSFKNRPNEALMSNFKQMAYLIQLEYDTNIGNPETKHQAKAYIEKTIKAIDDGASTYSDRDAEILSTILKDFTENGEISLDKLYGSFNSAEKNSIKVIQEVNAELGPIAQQTANVIRGEGITARNNYVHLNVINEKGSDPMANEAFIDGYTKSLKPSTRSKSLIKRQGVVSPLNFDVYTSALKGAKGTLLDFHMTDAVRTANATLNSTEGLLKGNEPRMSSENREKFNAIKEAYDTVLRIQFTNAYFSTTFVEDALNWVSKNGYRTMLAGSVRLISEFSSNSAFALLTNPKALISGVKIGIGFLNSDAAPEVMNNLNSTQTNRIYPNEDLSGRMIDTNLLNKKKGLKGARAKNKYMNKLTQVWNVTGDKYVNSVATLADGLISSPDKAIMRPVWFGAFSNEFKKITGLEPNLDKIAANDTNYMDANKEALDSATKHADEESIYTGATSNPFYGILRGQSMPTDTSFNQAYNAFNNFMLTFLMYEYMTVRTGVVSAMGQGSLSKTKGASLVAASATRMTMYTMMISVMGELMSNIVGGDDEEKDIKSLDKRLGQSIASTVLTISLGKSDNAYRSVINFLADGANEEYLDMLRDGEYDVYKDGLSFQTIPKEKNRGTGLADILLNLFAAYGPAVKTVDFIIKKSTEPEKKTDAAKERREKELMYRLPLEVLGNTGLIPMYKDVRKVVLGRIYNDIGSGSQEQKNYQKEVEKMKTSFGNGGFGNGGFGKDAGGFGNPK
jgi:hypothetical protein